MRNPIRGLVRGVAFRRLAGEYSVVSLSWLALAAALTLAIVETLPVALHPAVAGVAGCAALAIAVRLLAADRAVAMGLGGMLAPLGTAAALAAPGLGYLGDGVSGAGVAVGGAVLGLGLGLVVGQAFVRDRPRRAASRHLIATIAVLTVSVLVVLVVAGPANQLFGTVARLTSVVTAVLGATADPTSTAGPTLILAAVGLFGTAATLARLSIPSVFTTETRTKMRSIAGRWAYILWRASLVALVGGAFLAAADATGGLASLADAEPIRLALVAVGSEFARAGAVAMALLGVGSLAVVAASAWLRSLTLQQVAVAALPTLGLVAGGALIATALVTVAPSAAASLPVVGEVLATPGAKAVGVVGATLVALFLAFASTVAVTALHLLDQALTGETPGVKLVAGGVAVAGFVALVAASSAVAGFALFALAVFVADVGSYGWTAGSELGYRAGARVELLHGLGSALVAVVGVALARSLVGIATAEGPSLSGVDYAVGTIAVAVVLLTVGRQLSTR